MNVNKLISLYLEIAAFRAAEQPDSLPTDETLKKLSKLVRAFCRVANKMEVDAYKAYTFIARNVFAGNASGKCSAVVAAQLIVSCQRDEQMTVEDIMTNEED